MAREILQAWLPFLILAGVALLLMLWGGYKLKQVPELPSKLSGPADSITIGRDKQFSAILRDFLVVVDGSVVGRIGMGQVKHFTVSPGAHTVAMKIDWCTSKPFTVEKSANQNLPIRCGVKSNIAAFVLPPHYAYVKNDG